MTDAKKQRIAKELDARVRYLRLTGLEGVALFAAMSDRMADFKALMDAAGPDGMDGFAQQRPDLHHYAALLTSIAAGIRDGVIKVPR